MDPFIVEVAGIRGEVGASEDVTGGISLDPFEIAGVRAVFPTPAMLDGALTNTGDGFLLFGSVHASAKVQCSRCLVDMTIDVQAPLDTMFVDKAPLTTEEDQEIVVFEGDKIDLGTAVEAAVRLELPLAPLCDDDCKGICPACGTDLNASACDCHDEPDRGGPFSALEGFFDGNEE
jgi:uncharacterized protein